MAVDIDGTLGDYHGHFLSFAGDYLGDKYLPAGKELYSGRERFSIWFCNAFGVDPRTWRDIKLAYRQGGMKRSMPTYAGASALMAGIKEAGAEVWITTTRPHARLDNIDPDTVEWLRRNGIEYDALMYDDDKYEMLAKHVQYERVVAVLDDLPEMILQAQHAFGSKVPIHRITRWNRQSDVVTTNTAGSLHEAWQLIESRVEEWNESHA